MPNLVIRSFGYFLSSYLIPTPVVRFSLLPPFILVLPARSFLLSYFILALISCLRSLTLLLPCLILILVATKSIALLLPHPILLPIFHLRSRAFLSLHPMPILEIIGSAAFLSLCLISALGISQFKLPALLLPFSILG